MTESAAVGNFYALLRSRFEASIEQPFLHVPDGPMLTYAEIDDRSALMAGYLKARGVGAGDRVVVQLDKSIDAVALYLGVLRLGAVHVPLNTAYTAAERAALVADSEAAAVVADRRELEAALAEAEPFSIVVDRTVDDLAALVYTSGTTGRAKGAMLTHGNLASNALALHESWAFEPGDVLLHTLPIFHVHGLMVALHTAMLNGSTVIFLSKFRVPQVIDNLPAATVMMGVPTHYSRLLADDRFDTDVCRRIRLFTSGSAPMPAPLHEAVAERTGHEVLERYGMSEALMITSNPYEGDRVPGTVGFALPDIELRICDEEGNVVDVGDTGIVQVRGPNVGAGYWNQPEPTREAFLEDGWLITGDVGRLDSDGRLTLEGRGSDMIISGGYNVYPTEIELALARHDLVEETAVVGLEHDDLGEAIAAFVVAVDGWVDEDELAASLGDLARFKHPKQYVIVEELPRNAMGKIQKAELRRTYASLFQA